MDAPLAILHANCQGEPLAAALNASPEFSRAFCARVRLNYTGQPLPEEEIAACRLYLYQHLGPEWGQNATQAVLPRLPAGCASLCVPNMFFRGPWPLWSGAPGFDYRDQYLDHLIELGLPRRDILHLYLSTPLARKYDLAAKLAETIALEQEREARTPVKYLDRILETWRERQLFFTVNHPGPELMAHAATGVLRELGLAPPDPERLPGADATYAAFELPVHPQAAAFYGLAYGRAGAQFRVYGRERSFEDYAAAYVDCRLAGIDDFIGYLHLR